MRAAILLLALGACAAMPPSIFAPAPSGWESVVVEQSETVPAQTDWGSSFDLNVPARLQIDWSIEPGQMITYILATDAQYQRAVGNDADMSIQGQDYIRRLDALRGVGNDVTETLPVGRYIILMRNTANPGPAHVTIRAVGARQ